MNCPVRVGQEMSYFLHLFPHGSLGKSVLIIDKLIPRQYLLVFGHNGYVAKQFCFIGRKIFAMQDATLVANSHDFVTSVSGYLHWKAWRNSNY